MAAMALSFSFMVSAQERRITGNVLLLSGEESVPGESVTVYAKACGAGTITDDKGNYTLNVPGTYEGDNLSLEYSLIGYATVTRDIAPGGYGETVEAEPVVLDVQPLMIAAAYVTRSGMSPEEYILSQIWNKAEKNREVMAMYNADIRYHIATHEIPVVAQALSGFGKGTVKFLAGFTNYGPLVRWCLSHDDVSATVTMGRVVGYGTVKDFNKQFHSENKSLPKDVVNSILALPDDIDLFGMVYDRDMPWGEKFAKTHRFSLVGTYEYGDKLVDVLYWTDDNKVVSITLHVVEDDWGVLRVEIGREKEVVRFECRDIGNGIFMPVSLVMKPTMSLVRNRELPAVIKYINENRYVPKGIKKRSTVILTERYESGMDFNPYIVLGFNINYANVRM